MSRRVRDGKASRYAVRLVDAFEETWGGRTYFAAFDLVVNARDLEQMLEEEREVHRRTKAAPTRDPAVWARHVTWAKVFMAGIAALHESKIVHADLKPANALLIKDPSLSAGYELKLIDMEFLAARRPQGTVARVSGLHRHGQLPLAGAPDARRHSEPSLGHLHVGLDPS